MSIIVTGDKDSRKTFMRDNIRHRFGVSVALAIIVSSLFSSDRAFADDYGVHALVMGDEFIGQFRNPSGLFYDEEKERLYVADSGNGRLISFDANLDYLSEWGNKDLISPVSLVKNSRGKFYALDSSDHKVKYIDPQLAEVRVLEFKDVPKAVSGLIPGNISIGSDDSLYIIDKMNKRIIVLDGEEKYIRSMTVKAGGFYGFNDLFAAGDGSVYAIDTIGRKVHIFNETGKLVKSFGGPAYKKGKGSLLFPTRISGDILGNVYVLDSHRGKIMVYDKRGNLKFDVSEKGFGMGSLHDPVFFIIDNRRRIYTLESGRVQVLKRVNE